MILWCEAAEDKSREALKARNGKPISPAPHSRFPRRIGISSSSDPAAGEE
jgi:hypothetical protein